MFTIYTLFKFVHVLAVIVWVGGLTTIALITARLGREQDRSAQAAMSRQTAFLGQSVIGPSAGVTLILAPTAEPGDPRVVAFQSRLRVTGLFNLLLLVSVVAMMVFKPTL